MSSIIAQQTKLDLELVPKENRLDIGKCNGRIPRGLTPREPTFQVVLDAIALTSCYPVFLITVDVPEICPRVPSRDFDSLPSEEDTVSFLRELGHTREINSLNDVVVDQMHQPWRTFAALINRGLSGKTSGLDKLRLSRAQILWGMFYQKNVDYVELLWEDFIYQIENRVYKKQEKMYYPRFTKAIIHHFLIQEKSLSWRNKIGMHTSKDDYLINSLRFVSAKESTQIYGAILPECLTSPAMKESKAYKTYLGYATGVVPPKMARKFKKASPSKKDSDLVPVDEEPLALTELTEEAQMKELRKKSLRDFHKTRTSSSGTVAETPPRIDKITPTVTSEGTGDKPGVPDVTEDDSTTSESESWGNDEDDSNNDQELSNEDKEEEFVHTPSPTEDKDDDDMESESDDVIKSDEEKGMDDTTYQFDDDVDARLKETTPDNKEVVQGEGVDAEMNDAQPGNENLETTQEQVIDDAYVTITTIMKKTKVPVTSSSRSSDLTSKFLDFIDIPHADAEIVSLLDVHVHHEVSRTQAPTLLTIPISIITESSPVFINIPQSSHTFTPLQIQATPTPPSTIKTSNPLSSVFRFNDRITTLEKEVAELKKDPLHTQVSTLVDETREEFMNFLSEYLTARIKEQVKDQLPQILPKEVSNFPPPVIKKLIKESCDEVTLAKVSSQPHSTYEAASTLTEFELKKILIDKMEKRESYLAAPEHRDCYDNKDEDPSAGSDQGLKIRKLSKDAEPTTGPKKKDSTSASSKGTKSQPKYFGKSVQSEEPVFEVADFDMPQDQEGNLGDKNDEPRKEIASRSEWFKKHTPPQEPTDPDGHISKAIQEGPTQNWLMTLAASTSTDKSLKDFDELMSTPIDFSSYILNGLKIENLTQEVLLGPAFRLLKGTRSNYAELEYDFEECYKALSEKLDWENPEGGDYPFDLSKPLPLITRGKRQRVPFEFFINNDLKYLQGGISTMTYTTSTTKTKAAKYDLPGIEDMVPNIWSPVKVAYDRYALWGISHWRQQRKSFYAYARGIQSRGDVYSTKRILAVTHVKVMRKHGYRMAHNYRGDVADFAIALRMFTRSMVIHKRVEDLQLRVEEKPTIIDDPQGFIHVDDYKRNKLMRSYKLYKFSDGMLTRLLSSLEDITKNIDMEYLPKRR
ncbi:hypothetical protein Tco_1327226 [Tanacetum coccineum]